MTINGVEVIEKFDKVEINGFYIIPTDVEYDDESGYMCMQIIGYGWDENDDENDDDNRKRKYYNLGDLHDVVSLMNFGVSGISIDIEKENGYVRVFWTDRKPRVIESFDAFLSIFTVYGEELR